MFLMLTQTIMPFHFIIYYNNKKVFQDMILNQKPISSNPVLAFILR